MRRTPRRTSATTVEGRNNAMKANLHNNTKVNYYKTTRSTDWRGSLPFSLPARSPARGREGPKLEGEEA
jgi:hypothetical protein